MREYLTTKTNTKNWAVIINTRLLMIGIEIYKKQKIMGTSEYLLKKKLSTLNKLERGVYEIILLLSGS